MLKKIAVGLLVLAIIGYVTSIAINHAYAHILAFVMLVAAILFMLLVLAINLTWKLLPADFKKTYGGGKSRFTAIIFFSILLFYIAKGTIDEFCLPHASGFTSLLSNTTIFVFVAFLAWSLMKQGKAKTIVIGSVAFILFIALLSFVNSIDLKPGESTEADSIDKLKSLPYISWVSVEESTESENGVVLYDPELAFEGVNLYGSKTLQEAYLIDMHGNVVHKWAKDVQGCGPWDHHLELCENGDLLVISNCSMLVWLDWDSNVKAKKKMLVHHDVCLDENKNIHTIVKKREVMSWHGIPIPVTKDYITILSPNLEIIKQISLQDLVSERGLVSERFLSHRTAEIFRAMLSIFEPKNVLKILRMRVSWYKTSIGVPADINHANSIEIMDRDIEGFCRKGDWLISIRELDLVGIVDAKTETLGWTWGPGELGKQHYPTLLKNGNVLIFDNGRTRTNYSRIVELNPLTKEIVWEYKATPPERFYSGYQGSNQRLPNGNTLIAESDKGHVFEVTKEGKVVWEFYNPHIRIKEGKERQTMYRAMRIIDPEIYKLIKG